MVPFQNHIKPKKRVTGFGDLISGRVHVVPVLNHTLVYSLSSRFSADSARPRAPFLPSDHYPDYHAGSTPLQSNVTEDPTDYQKGTDRGLDDREVGGTRPPPSESGCSKDIRVCDPVYEDHTLLSDGTAIYVGTKTYLVLVHSSHYRLLLGTIKESFIAHPTLTAGTVDWRSRRRGSREITVLGRNI